MVTKSEIEFILTGKQETVKTAEINETEKTTSELPKDQVDLIKTAQMVVFLDVLKTYIKMRK
jgi:hypothetical protein